MQQYQQQNQIDTAIQVAHQILRKPPSSRQANSNAQNNEEDTSRLQAVQTLARSGKIKDLIERAEAQLKSSPSSIQLLQVLADYYKAANDKEKMKATYKKIADLHPDDSKMQFQVAQQLAEAGDNATAVRVLQDRDQEGAGAVLAAILAGGEHVRVGGKTDQLYALLESLDLRAMGNVYTVTNLVQTLIQDEKTREKGLALFRKAWKAFPEERTTLMDISPTTSSGACPRCTSTPERRPYPTRPEEPSPTGRGSTTSSCTWATAEPSRS